MRLDGQRLLNNINGVIRHINYHHHQHNRSISSSSISSSTPTFYTPSKTHTNAEIELQREIESKFNVKFDDYRSWWRWTCENYHIFWELVLNRFNVKLSVPYTKVVEDDVPFNKIPRWFVGARLNYAENCLKNGHNDQTAIVQASSIRQTYHLLPSFILKTLESPSELVFNDFRKLRNDVHQLANKFRAEFGIKSGDRICAYSSNTYETAVTFLAASAIGAVWSSASLDFGPVGVLDRFSQVAPKILVVVEEATYKGRRHSVVQNIYEILKGIPTVEMLLILPSSSYSNSENYKKIRTLSSVVYWSDLISNSPSSQEISHKKPKTDASLDEFNYEQVPFNHPLYILFSSGTTGKPKAMVHTVGGTLLKHIEEHIVQTNFTPNDRMFFYTTTGWMMWNWQQSVLFTGASIVLFDESPLEPDPYVLLRIAQNANVTALGMGAKIYDEYAKIDDKSSGSTPSLSEAFNLDKLRMVMSTASPLKPSTFTWINKRLKPGVQIASISGGTDLVGCFMGATVNLPVVVGECQHFLLGMDAAAFDENGTEVFDKRGELVCRRPFPSMPSHFLNDPNGSRYQNAYFMKFPGVWTHGDFISVSTDTGGVTVFGRSDTTLNRGGVRIGTAEIYNVVDSFEVVRDSLVVGRTDPADSTNEVVLLFLMLRSGEKLDDKLRSELCAALRKRVSPRHVPDEIHVIDDIPYTSNGKKVELAVKQVLNGHKVEKTSALRNPEALDYFLPFAVNTEK